jgi:hypothetical protein
MGRSEIVDAYVSFTSGGGSGHFLDCCLNYDFSGFDEDMESLKEVYWGCSPEGSSIDMVSNGSSGLATRYKFGPFPSLISDVENAMRGIKSVSSLVRLRSSYPWYDTTRFDSMRLGDGSTLVKLDLTSARSAEFFGRFVPEGSTVEVTPQICRAMEMHDEIVRRVNECGVKVVSTCDDLVCSGSFPVLDRMIDWKTGCNFYTCGSGCRHFLPVWFERDGISYNLLNPLNRTGYEVSDIFRVVSFRECACGRTEADFDFVSHYQHKPADARGRLVNSSLGRELYSLLPKSFNSQVIEQGGEAHVLLDRDGSEMSFVPLVEDFLGRPVRVHEGRVLMLGLYKMPFAWKTDELKTMPSHYPMI